MERGIPHLRGNFLNKSDVLSFYRSDPPVSETLNVFRNKPKTDKLQQIWEHCQVSKENLNRLQNDWRENVSICRLQTAQRSRN